jgi:hypothetical protein
MVGLAAVALLALGATTVHAEEPTLEVTSPASRCDTPLTFRGEGFDPGDSFSLGIPGMTEMTFLADVEVGSDGTFEVTLPALMDLGVSCIGGADLQFFTYRGTDQLEERPLASALVSFATPWRLTLESCDPLVVIGSGFSPSSTYLVLLGDDEPFADSFGGTHAMQTDAAGRFRYEGDSRLCSSTGRALFVRAGELSGKPVFAPSAYTARISLPSGVQTAPPLLPLPAETGGGPVEPSRGGRAPALLLAVAALVWLARRGVRT